jgi:hypothetical protein
MKIYSSDSYHWFHQPIPKLVFKLPFYVFLVFHLSLVLSCNETGNKVSNYQDGEKQDGKKLDGGKLNDEKLDGGKLDNGKLDGGTLSIPASLTAVSGNAQIVLTWASSPGASGYQVKRSQSKGGPYTVVTTVSGSTFTDTDVVNGKKYFYVVSAMIGSVESKNSVEVQATPSKNTVEPPTISRHPDSVTVKVGELATFSVVAAGPGSLIYQWFKNDTVLTGETNRSLTTSALVQSDDGSRYTVEVSNAGGSITSHAAILTVSVLSVTTPTGLFLDGFFPLAGFNQNWSTFPTWHDRGLNTMIGEPSWVLEGLTKTEMIKRWDQEAAKFGMKVIRQPLPNPKEDIGNTTLIAWLQEDEPNATGGGVRNLPLAIANYKKWKEIDPTRPVFLNFAGPDVTTAVDGATPSWCKAPDYNCSLTSNHLDYINKALDWVGNDLYPLAGYLPEESRRGDVTYIADPIDRIQTWTDKPQFAFVETSNQLFVKQAPRGANRDEVRAEIWVAIIHGVRGLAYFSAVVPPNGDGWAEDGTPESVGAELKIQNGVVTQLAPVLQGPINPPSLGATVPSPLQVGWRDAPSGRHFFVVNTKKTAVSNATLSLSGVGPATSATVFNESRTVALSDGKLTDSFGPYAVHIYVVAK